MQYIQHKNTKQIGTFSIFRRTYRILRLDTKCIQYYKVEIVKMFLLCLNEVKCFLEWAHQNCLKFLKRSVTNFSTRSLLLVAQKRRHVAEMKNKSMNAFYVKCVLVVAAYFIFITQIAYIGHGQGQSMLPTLSNSSVVFGSRIVTAYNSGDIVATKKIPNWGYDVGVTKRIVGVPGDVVVVDGINLYVNGILIDSSVMKPGYPYKEYVLGEDEYFLVGDNRSHSLDSRANGPVNKSYFEAKILFWINN